MVFFDKLRPLAEARQHLAEQGVDSIHVVMDEILSATEAVIEGRRTILVGTNNYLGLTFDLPVLKRPAELPGKKVPGQPDPGWLMGP